MHISQSKCQMVNCDPITFLSFQFQLSFLASKQMQFHNTISKDPGKLKRQGSHRACKPFSSQTPKNQEEERAGWGLRDLKTSSKHEDLKQKRSLLTCKECCSKSKAVFSEMLSSISAFSTFLLNMIALWEQVTSKRWRQRHGLIFPYALFTLNPGYCKIPYQ